MIPFLRFPLTLTFLSLLPLAGTGLAQERKPKADRISNRGPEQIDLRFKLPPPPVLTPEQARQAFKLQPGFRIECIASEPMVEAPVAMSWDTRGRLYVVEMRGYMHDVDAAGEDQPIGRVKRLEDLNGDGIMDKATVFADKLLMPRSVTAFGNGAIIAEPPNLVFYQDADDDGVAEKTTIIATDFGTKGGQPEHMANSLTFCQDNWLWAVNYGARFRWKDGKFISEPARSGGQWGLTQDDWGRRFYNYNSDFLRTDLLPLAMYARNPNLTDRAALNWRVLEDQQCWNPVPTPGVNRGYEDSTPDADGKIRGRQLRADGTLNTSTATCGPVIYRGGLFGPDFQGDAFIPEPAGNLVKRVRISEDGGVLKGKNAYQKAEFLTSSDERFRPVNAYNGPDGGLYIVDMARGVVQHKFFLTHYLIANIEARKLEQPLHLGRIWRIVPEQAKPQAVKLPKESAGLVSFLDHANGHVGDLARQTLVERTDAAVIPAVQQMAASAATPQGRVQALATLEGFGPAGLTPEVLSAALRDPHEKVRASAVRLSGLAQAGDLLGMTADPAAGVRVELALQLGGFNFPGTLEAVLKLAGAGGSPLLNDAIVCGVRGRELDLIELILTQSPSRTVAAESNLLQMLASCVMTERRAAKAGKLWELAAAQPAESPSQVALVKGIAGLSVRGGGKPQPRKLLYLDAPPAALTKLRDTAGPKLKAGVTVASGSKTTLLELAAAAIAWPGKEGVPPPPKIVPLTSAQQDRFEKGKVVYATLCGTCHQPSGAGMEGLAPPLVDSEWVLGPVDRPVKIILHGVGGPLPVAGRTWNLEMPPLPLSDDDIANVLTYLRREWEHNASPVEPAEVAKIRAAHAGRTKAWSAAELNPPKPKR